MTANNQAIAVHKGMSRLARAKFGPGMLLQHDDLEAMTAYTRDLSRLLFRSFFGCGVVCGLVVSVDEKCGKVVVDVAPGLALDCCGDPIHVPEPQQFPLDDKCDPDIPKRLWVVLCGTEKCCAPRTATCASDDDEGTAVCTRSRDAFEIRVLRARPECGCGCPEPPAYIYNAPAGNQGPAVVVDPVPGGRLHDCKCVDPQDPCYRDHYRAICPSCCGSGNDCGEGCDCDCVLLARLDNHGDDPKRPLWCVTHAVRRLIRPLLMEDPRPPIDARECAAKQQKYPSAMMLAGSQHEVKRLGSQLDRVRADREQLRDQLVRFDRMQEELQKRLDEARRSADEAERKAELEAKRAADVNAGLEAKLADAQARLDKAEAKAAKPEEEAKGRPPRKDKPPR